MTLYQPINDMLYQPSQLIIHESTHHYSGRETRGQFSQEERKRKNEIEVKDRGTGKYKLG